MRRIFALLAGLLLAVVSANAASENTVRITVLDSSTRASTADNNNGVPQNCEQLTFDAYCRSTTNVPLISTLLVQEDDKPPFRISCTIESRFSRCIPLAKGESFDARREKHGLEVYYTDDKGKERKQLYRLVDVAGKPVEGKSGPAAAAVAASPVSIPASPVSTPASPVSAGASPVAAAPRQSSPAPAASASSVAVGSAPAALPEKEAKVKCDFSSTPAGADIMLDGKYVGSTPSQIELITGTHVVIFSMPGFLEWKRELTVMPGSALTVNAILQKGE
ncbi:MAG: PEGA domain-containing protein [Candidatus Sulfotelmatobacter sp.]|jgi:hypothetical protein